MYAAEADYSTLSNGYESKAALEESLFRVCNVKPAVDLDTKGGFFEVRAVPVSDFGLDKFDSPLNHGYIKVLEVGTQPYVIVERGGTSAEDDSNSTLVKEFKCSYLKLANLFIHGYRMGGGSLVSKVTYNVKGSWFNGIDFSYVGWENDCWTRVEEVMIRAGFNDVIISHESNRAKVNEWLESEELGMKFLKSLGLMAPSKRRDSARGDIERPRDG